MQLIPIYVITLRRAAERRSRIVDHLESLGLDFEIVDAVDGAAIPEADRSSYLAPGRQYHPGVLGCYLSHLDAYKRIVDRNEKVACVLEDDARLNPALLPLLRDGVEFQAFDYCFLDCEAHNSDGPVFYDLDSAVQLGHQFRAYATNTGPEGLHAYLMSLEGARKRIEHAFPIEHPIDRYVGLPYQPRFYAVLFPKAAWVAEESRVSDTSNRSIQAPVRFRLLRRSERFYRIRDWLRLGPVRGMLERRRMQRGGKLPNHRRWRKLPPGRLLIYR